MIGRITPIRAEAVAAKVDQLLNMEQQELLSELGAHPEWSTRFVSVLWFLEYVSKSENYPGGLSKFADDLLDNSGDLIGTATMIKVGTTAHYTAADAVAVLRELAFTERRRIFGEETWLSDPAMYGESAEESGPPLFQPDAEEWNPEEPAWKRSRLESEVRSLARFNPTEGSSFSVIHGVKMARRLLDPESSVLRVPHKERVALLVENLTPAAAREACLYRARKDLARYFSNLAQFPNVSVLPRTDGNGAPSWFVSVGVALLRFIDARAVSREAELAETEVKKQVFRWVKKIGTMKEAIMISGKSRCGKTWSAKALCDMHPGSYRFVDTPAANGAIRDLIRAVAKSLGIEIKASNMLHELREKVDYVLRCSNLVLVFDEFQLFLPAKFSKNQAPERLNWVRRAVLDRGIPAVFICTPQSYLPAKKQFLKATGFAMEQFDERLLKTVHLPSRLTVVDAYALAKLYFGAMPDADEDFAGIVANAVLATERGYLSDIKSIVKLAKDNAIEGKRQVPLLCDVEEAIADVLCSFAEPEPIQQRNDAPKQTGGKPSKKTATAGVGSAKTSDLRSGSSPLQSDRNAPAQAFQNRAGDIENEDSTAALLNTT